MALKDILCKISGHKPTVIRVFLSGAYCVKCRRCKKYFLMSDSHKIILPWDCDFSTLYDFEPRDAFKNLLPFWCTCNICGYGRPMDKINVNRLKIDECGNFNLRYCNDSSHCKFNALNYKNYDDYQNKQEKK